MILLGLLIVAAGLFALFLASGNRYSVLRYRLGGDPDWRRLRRRGEAARAEALGAESAAALARYLEQMRAGLDLPEGLADDAVQEIADHVEDTRRALAEEGLEADAAVREALARLGSPTELAGNLRRAHQSRRRLLAGAAGGVFSIPAGTILGALMGLLAFLPALWVLDRMPDLNGPIGDVIRRPIPRALLYMVALFVAARTAVAVCTAVSRRRPSSIGWLVALLGTPLIAAWVLFIDRQYQSWPYAVAEMLVPAAFAAGAFLRVNGSRIGLPNHRWRVTAAIMCFGVVAGLLAGLTLPLSARDVMTPWTSQGRVVSNLDVAGPLVPQSMLPSPMTIDEHGMQLFCHHEGADQFDCQLRPSAYSFDAEAMAAAIKDDTEWSDYRIEVWPGIIDYQTGASYASGGIVPGASRPAISILVDKDGALPYTPLVEGAFRLPPRRDGPAWWILVTAQGPDGNRYRLTDGTSAVVLFEGTLWDWLTADG